MTLGGWIVMTLSVGSVTALFAWCMARVLRHPEDTRHLHGFEVEPPDTEDE